MNDQEQEVDQLKGVSVHGLKILHLFTNHNGEWREDCYGLVH